MIIPLKDAGIGEALNRVFRDLLEKKVVDALVVPQAVLSGRSFAHTLVKDPAQITNAFPFLPFVSASGARVVSSLTAWDPGQKLGVVLRACEVRALVELTKFKQGSLEQLFLIGVDCLGTMESDDFERMAGDSGEFNLREFLDGQISGDTTGLRKACQVCRYPVPENVSMNIGFIGVDLDKGLYLKASEEIAAVLGVDTAEDSGDRERKVSEIIENRSRHRDEMLAEVRQRFGSIPQLLNEFARCKRCYNCREECPICYCRECIFLTNIFDHKPNQYLHWAERKGAIKLPYDTLLFHLTRLNHMATSCTGCGQCSSACPNGLPVFELFQLVGSDVQSVFEYSPGDKPEEVPPIVTFREDELEKPAEP
jgi:formate dehydrogenase subunit beta